jgi:hypothetical protein
MNPVLEVNENCIDKTTHCVAGKGQNQVGIMISPSVDENYWMFRVKLCNDQAVLGFPKLGMIGVGMALEENSNTNLPLHTEDTPLANANRIYSHIKCNKKYKSITRQMIVDAIILIVQGSEQYCIKGERAYEC